MEISYVREMRKNYLVVEARRDFLGYEARMLAANPVQGLLPMKVRYMDGSASYYYDITSRQPLGRLLESRQITVEEICGLIRQIHGALRRMEEFFLGDGGILLEPEYIYMEPEAFQAGLCFVPGAEENFQEGLSRLLQYLLRHVDHRDRKAVILAYSLYQESLKERYQSEASNIIQKYIPEDETSFTIIAWPRPETGENFGEIFDEIIKINTLPEEKYRRIQQRLTDALDEADYILIEGAGKNSTKLKVMLHRLSEREKETNFENCLADVNIPLGEVFTSPVLKGTEGRLNVSSVYIGDTLFKDLKLDFKDGRVTDYSCGNFPDNADLGRRLVEDIIFKNKKSLPIGEFAVGTNTTAYEAGRRLGIIKKLPILIAEKMGPHFAVGDTCYSHAEELKVFNPDGKEIIARSNECADLRNERPEDAYFNVHCDITIPYDEVGLIAAVKEDGEMIEIIKDGYFVLSGTEELNEPLKKI